MALIVDFFKPGDTYVGVYLGRGQAGVAQQLLHTAQIRAPVQQVRGEGMPQRVGA